MVTVVVFSCIQRDVCHLSITITLGIMLSCEKEVLYFGVNDRLKHMCEFYTFQ